MDRVVFFDGECLFCDRSVRFIIKRDPQGRFKFASQQSETGQDWLARFNITDDRNSLILVEHNKAYFKSTAALRICKNLSGAWKGLYLLVIIPKPVRDFVYGIVAKNRYKWFGKKESCTLPSPEERDRFL
ncbi:thiol-disulfide oxidoreductase DCC family protein [Gorillibacterium massiliense]|uniref:thiol-disulfide oxidoreductase DCC family protein n=1 Tax=Gorillibacterium massiliense TaxID=1280390 RepID=UPI0004B809BF|nr:thiol-disulfide oxidoreductase DCC family protein [Gorillibacterium massiliense]